jgi:hypothetical protein
MDKRDVALGHSESSRDDADNQHHRVSVLESCLFSPHLCSVDKDKDEVPCSSAASINSTYGRYSNEAASTTIVIIATAKRDLIAASIQPSFYRNNMASDALSNISRGLVFGVALAASGVASPSIIIGQFTLRESHMLKVFLTATATSA